MVQVDLLQPGDLLLPNEYMVNNGDSRLALVLRRIDRGNLDPDYELLFSDGFVNQVQIRTICALYTRADVQTPWSEV